MSIHMDGLRPSSSRQDISAAVSESVTECMQAGGRSQNECVAMAQDMAKRKTRNGSGSLNVRNIRTGLGDRDGPSSS